MTRQAVYGLIDQERARQADKWSAPHGWGEGDCSSVWVADTTKLAVLVEEVGEVARAVLEKDMDAARRELVQVAAVAVAWLEACE